MIRRSLEPILQQCLAEYPGILLIGARQSGKTTLAKAVGGLYFDLEQESDRLRLDIA